MTRIEPHNEVLNSLMMPAKTHDEAVKPVNSDILVESDETRDNNGNDTYSPLQNSGRSDNSTIQTAPSQQEENITMGMLNLKLDKILALLEGRSVSDYHINPSTRKVTLPFVTTHELSKADVAIQNESDFRIAMITPGRG